MLGDGSYWNWNTQPLPELTDQVQAAFEAAGIPGATANVYEFGEDCFDPQTGAVVRFASMETDFDFQLEVEDLQDLDALGNLTERVLAVLDGFPAETTPGPLPGQIWLLFKRGDEERGLLFTLEQLDEARSRGLSGRELLEAQGYEP